MLALWGWGWVGAVGLIDVAIQEQAIPASSLCWQSFTPMPLCLQSNMLASLPVHCKSSSQIRPVPERHIMHNTIDVLGKDVSVDVSYKN